MPRSKSQSGAVNLYDIYTKVCNRNNRGSTEPGVRRAADEAAKVASQLIDSQSIENIQAFKAAEKKWAKAIGGVRISLAKEFSRAIFSGNYYVKRRGVNSAWNKKYQPLEGFIYGATSTDRIGWIKLGATTVSPLERIEQIKKHYHLQEMSLMFFAEVSDPMRVEDEVRKCLKIYNKRKSQSDSREWFDISPDRAFETAADAIIRLRVKVTRPITATIAMRSFTQMKPHSIDWISHGGRLAIRSGVGEIAVNNAQVVRHSIIPDLISKVASRNSPFAVGVRVTHKKNAAKFGTGEVTSMNAEILRAHFSLLNREIEFPTKSAVDFLQALG